MWVFDSIFWPWWTSNEQDEDNEKTLIFYSRLLSSSKTKILQKPTITKIHKIPQLQQHPYPICTNNNTTAMMMCCDFVFILFFFGEWQLNYYKSIFELNSMQCCWNSMLNVVINIFRSSICCFNFSIIYFCFNVYIETNYVFLTESF